MKKKDWEKQCEHLSINGTVGSHYDEKTHKRIELRTTRCMDCWKYYDENKKEWVEELSKIDYQ